MKTRLALVLLLLSLLGSAIPAEGGFISLTFAHATGTTPSLFTVYGNVLGTENVQITRPTYTIWSDDWYSLESVSDWAVLTQFVPPPTYPFTSSVFHGQMMVGQGTLLGTEEYFRYYEGTSGYDAASLEAWGHGIDVRAIYSSLPPGATDILSLLNVVGGFSYEEATGHGTNYTPDGSTAESWTRSKAEGTLTLVAYDLSATCPSGTPACEPETVPQPVPEPASLLLFGTGFVGLRALRKRRQ